MTEFGPNGTVLGSTPTLPGSGAGYSVPAKVKFKRIGLASFLCGLAACILVALIGGILLFLVFQTAGTFNANLDSVLFQGGVLQGVGFATLMAAFNWYFAYFTIPAAWLALFLSIGRFPRRGILEPMPYYRWGGIWGAFLVGSTTGIASFLLSSMDSLVLIGGLLTGFAIGGAAGVICGAIFRAIVRPAEQVRKIQVDVF